MPITLARVLAALGSAQVSLLAPCTSTAPAATLAESQSMDTTCPGLRNAVPIVLILVRLWG